LEISQILFHALACLIHAFRAFLLALIIFAHIVFCLFHQTIIEKAASVFIQYFLSFTQKSIVTRSPFLKTNHVLGRQWTTISFTLIQTLEGNQ